MFGYRQIGNSADSELSPGQEEGEMFTEIKQSTSDEKLSEPPQHLMSRELDRNPEDLYRRFLKTPDQPKNPRLLRVAIVGEPNAGKSTLINKLMGWKLNGVSSKVHTTRKNVNTVFTIDNVQIILVDTPGVITTAERRKHSCPAALQADPQRSLQEADAVGVIIDVSNKWTRLSLHRELLKILYLHRDVPSFLIINKIDTLSRKSYENQRIFLLDIMRRLSAGVIGGKEFVRAREPLQQKKETTKTKDKFDYLEKKYGKLEIKRRVLEDQTSHESVLNPDFLKLEYSDKKKTKESKTIVSHDVKFEENKPNILAHDKLVVPSMEVDSTDELDEIDSSDKLRVNTEKVTDEVHNKTEIISQKEKIQGYKFEDSYQSNFLSQILSTLPLQEFLNSDEPKINENKEMSEVEKVKEAEEAVKGKHGWSEFDRVFPVSAIDGQGIDALKNYLVEISRPADWIYHSSVITEQHPYDIAKMCVIQSMLDHMGSYLPYVMNPEIIYWDVDDSNALVISVEIKLRDTYQMKLVFQNGGAERIRAISSSVRQALMDAFHCDVHFKLLFVKKKKHIKN